MLHLGSSIYTSEYIKKSKTKFVINLYERIKYTIAYELDSNIKNPKRFKQYSFKFQKQLLCGFEQNNKMEFIILNK